MYKNIGIMGVKNSKLNIAQNESIPKLEFARYQQF